MAQPVDRTSQPRQGRPWAVAHRGASHLAPENTLSALRSALARGADMVEVDVRRTADGALVLLHDDSLRRTTDVAQRLPARAPWRVECLTLDEIKGLDAGRWKSSTFAGEAVPTLDEAWDLVRTAGSRLLLEVKQPATQPGIMDDVARVLEERPPDPGQVVVQSFDTGEVAGFAARNPDIAVGLLAPVPVSELPRVATWASYINPHHCRVWTDYVCAVHAQGMRCMPWTVDDPRRVRWLLAAGVDGVISNRPRVVTRVRGTLVGGHRAD